ncbi:MAG: pentapeptide repeat-containing protein [Blastocatellia bacterium]
MSFHSSDIEVSLSCDQADRPWAERLAEGLGVEGIRVRWVRPHASPGEQWEEWLAGEETRSQKLIVVCGPDYFRDELAASLIARFTGDNLSRLLTERPVIPVLRRGYQLPATLSELRPIDFSNDEDFELRLCQLAEALDVPVRNAPEAPNIKDGKPGISAALNSLFRWIGLKEPGSRIGDGVADLYRLLGFETVRDQKLNEVPVDLLIEKRTGGINTKTVIECHERLDREDELDALILRQRRIRQVFPKIDCLVVTAQPLDEPARAKLENSGISHITYPALLGEVVPLDGYVGKGLARHGQWRARHWRGEDWFIRPDVNTDLNKQLRPALEQVNAWLRGGRGSLLVLLGDVGTGKTTLARFLAYEMARAYQQDPLRHPAPVLVDLKDVRKETSLESILITHFREHLTEKEMGDFSLARFDHLVRHGRVVLLFDAFDEMAERMQRGVIRKNIEELIKPVKNGGKILVTCRTHYFKDIREQEGYVGEGAVYLQEFSNEQVQRYLRKARPRTAEKDWERIQEIYNLKELVARPLLLDMVVKTMPELREVDASALYAKYSDFWFDREQEKGRLLDKEVKLFLMKELAWQIWDEEKHQIHFNDLLRLVKRLKGDERDFYGEDVEDVAEELRTASFLTRNDEGFYSFADRSFGEYFLASKIHESLAAPDDMNEVRKLLRTRLFNRKMIFFLTLLMKQTDSHRLLRNILTGDYEAFVSENALQILYWSGRMHCGMEDEITDYEELRQQLFAYLPRGIRMSNARLNPLPNGEPAGFVLEGADLGEADFSGADLTGVNLNRAILQGANFRGAILTRASLEGIAAVHADFREAELSRARLRQSNVRYCDFTGAIHRNITFEENDTRGARGLNLAGDLLRSDLIPVVQQTLSAGTHSIAIAPNGEWYASGSRDGLIALHRASDDRLLLYFDGHKRRVHSLQFSPSGALLVSGCQDGVVRLWSVSDGRLLQEIPAHKGAVRAVRFSPNGALAASAGDDRSVRLWRVDEGKALRSFGGFEGHTDSVHAVHFSPDGRLLASAGSDGAVRVWDVNSDHLLHVLREEEDSSLPQTFRINTVQFSPDGRWLAGTDALHRVVIWDAGDGKRERVLKGHTDDVMSLCFSPDSKLLASGGKDLSMRVWSVREGTLQDQATDHSDLIDTVWFSADGKQLSSGCTDRVIRSWHWEEGRLRPAGEERTGQLLKQSGAIRALSLSPDGRSLVCGGDDRHLYVWSARESRLQHAPGKHRETIRSIDFSPDGAFVATGSEDRTVRIWSAAEGNLLQELGGHDGKVTSVHFSPARNLLVSASEDRSLRLWLAPGGEFIYAIRGPQAPIHAARFSPDGELLAAACEDQSVWMWSAKDGQSPRLLRRFEGHVSGVTTLQFSPAGIWLATGGKDNQVRLWRVAGDLQRQPLEGHSDRITSLAFSPASSPSGSFLASGSSDGSVRVWDVETGRLMQTLTGHLGEVHGLAITRNSRCLIAAGFSGRLQFWDLESGKTALYRYGIGPDAWLDVLPDGRFNASPEGRRYLCFTEQGALHSHSAETLLTEFYDPGVVETVLSTYAAYAD